MLSLTNYKKYFLILLLLPIIVNGEELDKQAAGSLDNLDLSKLTLEKIMDIKVITASKKEEKLFSTSSAVYVVTDEDMKRRGVRNIPEALRGVPGIQVSQRSSNSWEVAGRGFDNWLSNKLLVLVDGRSVYTPIFSGVYWHTVNYPIEDIERIEVIRGPGSTIWGANAVNGVINIITKNSSKTIGGLLQTEFGTESQNHLFRYGFALDEEQKLNTRVYGQFTKNDVLNHGVAGKAGGDNERDWDHFQLGMRVDYQITKFDSIRLSADGFSQEYSHLNSLGPFRDFHDSKGDGFNSVLEYRKDIGPGESFQAKFYYDYINSNEEQTFSHKTHTWDGSLTYNLILGDIHHLTIGGGARIVNSIVEDPAGFINLRPRRESVLNTNIFFQDKITLIEDKLFLTLGTKIEFLEYTGTEFEPTVRLSYAPDEKNLFWAAYSRAVRSPSRFENNSSIFGATIGNHQVDSEVLDAYEIGYRSRFEKVTLDLTAFYYDYDRLVLEDSSTTPRYVDNAGAAKSYGVELALDYDLLDNWRLRTSYTFFDSDHSLPADHINVLFYENRNAKHKASVHSYLDITDDISWDVSAYYSDRRETYGNPVQRVNSYIKLDSRLAWKVKKNMEVYLLLKNLLDGSRREAGSTSELPRSFSVGFTYQF